MDKYQFGEFIYQKRKSVGLTQDELGKKLGVTNKAVSKWETGETIPEVNVLINLAKVLNVTIDELLTQEVVESEVVTTIKYKTSPIMKVVMCLLLMVIGVFSIVFIDLNNNTDEIEIVDLTEDNYLSYLSLYPTEVLSVEGNTVFLDLRVDKIDDRYVYEDTSVTIIYTVHCYFVDNNDASYVISYFNHYAMIDIQDYSNTLTIELSPKSSNYEFSNILKIEVNYEIGAISGKVINGE